MHYTILDSKIKYKNERIHSIVVLIDCTGPDCEPLSDVRAVYATTKQSGGYMSLTPNAVLTDQLLQQVAAAGIETVDRDELFPNWKELALEIL